MDNNVYIALSKQVSAMRHMDVVANNIANANTTGFQAEKMMFHDYVVRDDGTRNKMAFAQDISTYHDMAPGSMELTENPLDMAISGDGYFVIEGPGGQELYTRAGNFQLDGQGIVVTADGMPVLDNGGGRIILNPDDRDISVGASGNLSVNGQERAVIGMVEFANPQRLKQVGGSMFSAGEQAPLEPTKSRMLHGMLEESNVSAIHEIVDMTKLSRGVTKTAEYIEVMYDLQRKASDTYAKQ